MWHWQVEFPLAKDPTSPYKRKLINIIKRWQSQDPIPQQLKHRIYPTAEEVPKIYGLPKIHKPDFPLRPIVASRGGITYNAARVLADILSPLVGQSDHHVMNSSAFVDKIQDLEVPPGQKLISYDVTALFTSIPVPDAIEAVQLKLSADDTLSERTSLSIDKILELLKFCLDTTYFVYKNQLYKQKRGAAMGSPVSPIIANLYMEVFEERALSTAPHPPSLWFRYVDDTFTKIHEYYVEEFTRHINSIDPNIIFTTEPESNGVLPFLDTCVHINDDGSTHVTVYRKPTHTDQYLNFKFNHHIEHKRSVVRTLLKRADVLVTKPEDKSREVEHVKRALRTNQYEEWAFETPRAKPRDKPRPNRARTSIGLPYIHGTSEKLSRIFRAHDVGVYHRPINTIRSLLVHPKDKTPDLQKCGVVYQVTCPQCQQLYVGETGRTLATRMKDHTSHNTQPIAVGDHCREHGHVINKNNVEVLAREEGWFKRKIREAIEIKTLQPTTNRDQGFDLPAIYSEILPVSVTRDRSR